MPRFLFALPVALLTAVAVPGADWYQFRGPTGQGYAESKNLPTEWSPGKNLVWRTAIPGLGWSSPVIAAGRVYLTTAVPAGDGKKPDYSLRALCIDAKSGSILWSEEVFQERGAASPTIHGKNSHASPTPIVEEGKVYVHFGHMGTACLNAKDGSKVWATQKLRYNPVHGNGGSPIIAAGKLIFSIDGTDKQAVIALDKQTGAVAWETPRNAKPGKAFSFSTPLAITVNGQEQVVSAGSDVVMALDPKSGREIWRVKYSGYSVVPRPVYGNGLLYVCTGYDDPGLYAIRVDGKGDVTDTHVAWTLKKDSMPRNAAPLLVGDSLYTVSDGGLVSCLDARTGKIRWSETIGRPHSASPISAGGLIYLLAEDGTGTVFKPGETYDEVAKNKFSEQGSPAKFLSLASYAVDGDALFLRTAKALYRIEKK
jgi:outer membrane protein assembly factor BamB